MQCRIVDLRNKEVVNICTACRLGFVCDVEIDTCTGKLVSIIVVEEGKLFSFGKAEEFVVPWCNIEKIGEDVILVNFEFTPHHHHKRKDGFFG